ncbi:hypothetical protein [Actinomycetospora termitidis]|uniref:Integral membrane protein n=1 Tax=Actinomycetospora termitidis TaxID=3053470 RepID=A0ABT7M2S3_9PSEU|nr:hypothetical protein [Actinomycetospora sp. Odt1-22]MDL5154960.1 hypothetical protein [Actinomycetospora sp. Odt1-22]
MGDAQAAMAFYQLLASVSFTLLGLWFTALNLAHADWRHPGRHRERLHVALLFLLPGTLGLTSVLAGSNPIAWRVVFVLGGVIGLGESLVFLIRRRGLPGAGERVLAVLAPVLYALVVATAFVPTPVAGLVPLQIEGFVVAAVFLVGLTHVWRAFAERPAPAT